VVCDQPSGIGPIAGRECVSYRFDDLAVISEPARGPAVEVSNRVGHRSAKLETQEVG
jgi:hypothetical protein